jgi:DNA replication licensing factor MCM3
VEMILDHDLVDRIKPGDRVEVVGVYRALAANSINGQSSTSGVFHTVVLVNNISILNQSVHNLTFVQSDVQNIRALAKSSDILSILGRSLSPSIHGHDVIKKALVLQLLAGVEKNLANGTHLRGDVNILLVGDPSTAKSQLLRSVMTMAPLAISTTGKGSSGVGLTAAVTSDPDTRERRLEAGAMVLGDRGIVCIDEFDKMGETDRVAIHEAMEQQTVTISKAGIHASLNARCSVLAAANPVYGNYDRDRRIVENIGLPDSLLSRFDLLFVVLDQLDPDLDRRIAGHVIRGHGYRKVVGKSGYNSDDDDDEDDDDLEEEVEGSQEKSRSIWQRSRYDAHMHNQDHDDIQPMSNHDILHHDFLRKYLHFAKTRIKPTLTEEARECIAARYAEMRSRQDERTLPITARSLETVIRLASAHAKARLSQIVEAEPDVKVAMDILGFALYHENHQMTDSEQRASTPDLREDRKRTRMDVDSEGEEDTEDNSKSKPRLPNTSQNAELGMRIWNELQSSEDSLAIGEICKDVADRSSVKSAIQELERSEKVMLSDDTVYII